MSLAQGKKMVILLVVSLFLLSLAAVAVAAPNSKLDQVLARKKVIVGVTSTTAPFGFRDAKGNLAGFDVDMGKALAFALFGKENAVEFVVEKEDARIPNLLNNKVDVVIQFMSVTAQRATLVEFTEPYFESWLGFIVREDSPYKSLNELKGKQISMLQNVYAEDLVHAAVPTAKVVQFDTNSAAVLALDTGRVEANMDDLPIIKYLLKTNPGKFRLLPGLYTPQNFAMAVKPGDYRWLQFLNTFIQEMKHGTMYESHFAPAYRKWFGEEPPYEFAHQGGQFKLQD